MYNMKKQGVYPKIDSNANFAEVEQKILKFWQENNIFQRSVDEREGSNKRDESRQNEFIFYDGPPFANGLPHYGHLLTGFIKDTYARYQTMRGKKVERRFGWDCHGLPAEMGAEKDLGISGRNAIIEYGIDKFNDHCKNSVMKFTGEWEEYVTRQARWVDFHNDYKTMDKNFMESVLWAFKELYKKGYIYQSMKVMPYSWACETPLSNFETRLDNAYRERADKTVTVAFDLEDKPAFLPDGFIKYRVLAWTTTPWTLPSNLALAVGPDLEYVGLAKGDEYLIIGKFALNAYSKELGLTEETKLDYFTGNDLVGLKFKPLLPYFADQPNAFQILAGDFVVEGDGTGIVHIAPGFGEDDQILCASYGIELVCPVDNAGKFTNEVPDFCGQQVFDANDQIIIKLKEQGNWLKTEQYLHNYPHCWRTDTPLIYKAVPSWYVKVTEFKDRMVELNEQINWIPGHVKHGMFGKWLENARDWAISRNRFWGTPLPVWQSDDPKYPRIDVYGSIAELEADFGVKIEDLHRPFIDSLTRPNPDDPSGKSMMRRVEDVFDCWFESGSMPYGQAHYPFENKEWFERNFPADFIVEYSAQTRGWFYTLMVLSTALFDRPPFLNCICHGVILDASGQKLSKRLNNYADPMELFAKYGADALRMTMLSSTVVRGQELLIDKDGEMIRDTLRLYIKPIWNAYHFFTLYANADSVVAKELTVPKNLLNRYIISKLKIAIYKIKESLDQYDTLDAYAQIANFFEVLNNWFIRRSRAQFWKSEYDQDKQEAYDTLYTCLMLMAQAMSPILPLITEEIYQSLKQDTTLPDSVHLCLYPESDLLLEDAELVAKMDIVRDICSSALFVRNQDNIRIRQPLNSVTVISKQDLGINDFDYIIKDEVNVKSVNYDLDLASHAEVQLILNFPVLGKRLPDRMKQLIPAAKKGQWSKGENGNVMLGDTEIYPEEFSIKLKPKNALGAAPLAYSEAMVMLDLNITSELEVEGIARDLVRLIQQARKDSGFDVSDRVKLEVIADDKLINLALKNFGDYIQDQTLSILTPGVRGKTTDGELNGVQVQICLMS